MFTDQEEATYTPLEYNGSNAGLVSESLIRLTPEEERSGVFRLVLRLIMSEKYIYNGLHVILDFNRYG